MHLGACVQFLRIAWLLLFEVGRARAGHESWISTTEDGGAPSITTGGPEKDKEEEEEEGFSWGDGLRNNACDGELAKDG